MAPTVDADRFAYLDHAATTPVRPEAVEAMLPFLTTQIGNPSGSHRWARDARRALDDARDVLADVLGAEPGEVVFTSGGTEADNLAVFGVHDAAPAERRGVVCSAVEHHAVLHPVHHVGGREAPVDQRAVVDLDALGALIDECTCLVSVMLANNEVGVIQDLAAIADVVHDRAPAARLHTDAVHAFSWVDLADRAAPADLISVSAHKFGGPMGIGALVVRGGTRLSPLLLGGGQERERRSGTQPVALVAGMAAAARVASDERKATVDRTAALRDRLADGLLAAVPDALETAPRHLRTAGNCHLCFAGVEGEALLLLLEQDGILASAGSSCASGAQEPSHVLTAMGVPRHLALGAARFTLGPTTTSTDVERALAAVPRAVRRLRERGS